MVKILKNVLSAALITSLLTSCAGIPAGKVRLENYPEVQPDLSLDLGYARMQFTEKTPDVKEKNFTDKIVLELSRVGIKSDKKARCLVEVSSHNDIKDSPFLAPYALISMLTLVIVPYYVPLTYEAQATLISHPKDSEISGTILPSISGAKPGDIFLDSDDQPAKILKTYELKDKVHEVWSSLMLLAAIPITSLRKLPSANAGKMITENTISEALVRSILHDASTFKECQKPPSSPSNKR